MTVQEKQKQVFYLKLSEAEFDVEALMKQNAKNGAYGPANFNDGRLAGIRQAMVIFEMIYGNMTEDELNDWVEYYDKVSSSKDMYIPQNNKE